MTQRPVIIGAGPAGLTAAHELVSRAGVRPLVLESSHRVGGLSATVPYRGNRMDIGGHRFFSKSERVMQWWLQRLPLAKTADDSLTLSYQGAQRRLSGPMVGLDPHEHDDVMLVRERTSRIYWHGRLFEYPLNLSGETFRNLGVKRAARSGLSYLRSSVAPVRDEQSLEDFLINRFGRELYRTFFKSYTEKVWGVPCDNIPAEWGAQRIKGVSIREVLAHALRREGNSDVLQQGVETSLIERFLYPKFGPGQMWETVADEVAELGGEIAFGQRVVGVEHDGKRIHTVVAEDTDTGQRTRHPTDYVFSSMPIPALVDAFGSGVPQPVRRVAGGLKFRDFFTIGLLVDELRLRPERGHELIRDNWIYIQEPDVGIGRLQIFNNWSPWLVADPTKAWLGLEYFCSADEPIWSQPDRDLLAMGVDELVRIGVIDRSAVRDGCVLRVPKTYPAYFGAYDGFPVVRDWLQGFDNLFCVGRNGQHRYNNMDHSMLTAMLAVDGLLGHSDADIWQVNTEQAYHEQR